MALRASPRKELRTADLHLKARGAAASLEPGRRSGGDCCAGRGRTARLPRSRCGALELLHADVRQPLGGRRRSGIAPATGGAGTGVRFSSEAVPVPDDQVCGARSR